jgi:competence protein CoiA
MKFAIVDGCKTEALKGAKGICPNCGSELIAKCGEFKMNHWAHKGVRNCDSWWETETEWHRSWKNNFPDEWQEHILFDELTNEKHIADILTIDNLVIEFQHSHIDPQERSSRENFYNNMVWVVDGTRLKRDYPRFLKAKDNFQETDSPKIFLVDFEECFPSAWLGISKPIIFDFRGTEEINNPNDIRNNLYCLFPIKTGRYVVVEEITHTDFLISVTNGDWLPYINDFMNKLVQREQERLHLMTQQKQLLTNSIINRFIRNKQSHRGRGRFT